MHVTSDHVRQSLPLHTAMHCGACQSLLTAIPPSQNKAHKKANPVVVEEDAASDAHATLPISLVKKVMVLGQDGKGRCTADGVKCMARAAELFLGALARRAGDEAQGSARATVNFRDIGAKLAFWCLYSWAVAEYATVAVSKVKAAS